MSSDDERPPVFDGPYGPVRDLDEPFEDAPSLVEILEDIKAKQEPKTKGQLDPKQFHGEHYICLDAAHAESGRFRAYRFLGRFVLDYIWNSDYPENVLKNIFMMCLNYAMNGAEAMNIAANHFIFLLTARHLDYEIAVHFKKVKKIEDSMAETILTRFEIVDQSNKSKKRPSICEESFVIDVTAIESGFQRKKLAGRGRSNSFEIPYNISEGATYNLVNNDNFCLFRAFEWLRMKHVLQQQRFSDYKRNERRQQSDITTLCQACGINMNLPFYSIEEYGERIQAYYDQHYPGMFRLFCFGTFGKMKPLWKSKVIEYKQELCVLFTEGEGGQAGHFNPIKSTGRLFGSKTNYCFGCEIPYTHQTRHNGNCKWKCRNCQRVGNTFRGTCKDSGFCASCLGCGKTFESRECFEHHAKVVKVTIKKGDKEAKIDKQSAEAPKNVWIVVSFIAQWSVVAVFRRIIVCFSIKTKREAMYVVTSEFLLCTRDLHELHREGNLEPDAGAEMRDLRRLPDSAASVLMIHWQHSQNGFCSSRPKRLLGLDHNERGKKRKHTVKHNNNNEEACFFDNEADDDEDNDGNDAENNYMLGYDEGGEKPKSVKTYAYAHAGSRYDHMLIFGEMLRMGVRPDLTFGLNIDGVENKKYFPHNLQTTETSWTPFHRFRTTLQEATPEERIKLEKWHADNINTRFDLREIIADYCKTDVQILVHGVLKMRELFMAETKHDLTDSITIPSACIKYFVALSHQDNERIAIVPHLYFSELDL
ncbi:hypothetical protein niasHT_034076 [Heterodera trifolii]|uniref:OTU domain-containing protein n=1 Tax=Heterodera trifolii TaxID=157864 RepID=A0ABD2I3F1_9BILA